MFFACRRITPRLAGGALFLAGIVPGSIATRNVSALNKFGQPNTVIHVVAYKSRDALP